ncbi:MAG TPA: hypothetical protein VHA74_02355 [Candidatus Dojkabacteria bacterium]|nr:hypothetical protein [Candidatus Dojkabacteria bacterium]
MDNTPINTPVATEPIPITTPVVSEPNPITEPIAQPSVVETTTVQQPTKKNPMKIILITLVVLLLLSGIGAAVWYFYFRDKGTTTNNNIKTTTDNTNNNQDNTNDGVDPKTYNSTLLYATTFSKTTGGLTRFDVSTNTATNLPKVKDFTNENGGMLIYQRYGTRYALIDTYEKGQYNHKLSLFDKSNSSLKEVVLPVSAKLKSLLQSADISPDGKKAFIMTEYGTLVSVGGEGGDAKRFEPSYTDLSVYNFETEKQSSIKRFTSISELLTSDRTWSTDSRYVYFLCESQFCADKGSGLGDLAGLTTIDTENMTLSVNAKYNTWEGVYASTKNRFLAITLPADDTTPSEVFIVQDDKKTVLHSGEFADFQIPNNLSPDQKYALYDKRISTPDSENVLHDTMVVNLETKTESQLFKSHNFFTIQEPMWISNTEIVYIKDSDDQKSIGLFKAAVTTGVSTQLLLSDKY